MTPATTDLERRARTLADAARELQVTDQPSYDLAAERLRAVVGLRTEIVEHHREMKARSYQAWQAVIAAEKKLLDPVAEAERVYKAQIGAYDAEQRRIGIQRQHAWHSKRKSRRALPAGLIKASANFYSLQTPRFIRPLLTASAASKLGTGLLTTR